MSEHVELYMWFAAAGSATAFTRFLRSKSNWRARVVVSSVLTGALASIGAIAWWYGDEAVKNQFKCLAISLAIGFTNPELVGNIWERILKSKMDSQ